jgi:HK97 family phage major capsid protein
MEISEEMRALGRRRAELLERAHGILDAASGRNLTNAQARDFAAVMDEVERLNDQIKALDNDQIKALEPECRRSGPRPPRSAEPAARLAALDREIVWASRPPAVGRLGMMDGLPEWPAGAEAALLLGPAQPVAARARSRAGAAPHELNFNRWLRAVVSGDWRGAPAELEEMRALGAGGDATGGFLVPEVLSGQIIDLARAQARVIEAGARTRPVEGASLIIPTVEGDPTATWKAENVEGGESAMSFGALVVRPRLLFALVKASRELIEDAPLADDTIRRSLTAALALEMDRAALRGTGAAQEPLGVRNTAGIQTVAGVGTPNYDDLLTAVELVRTANGEATAALLTPRDAGTLSRLKDTQGQYLSPPPEVAALARLTTTQIPVTLGAGNESEIYVADWARLVWAVRTPIVLEVSNAAGDSSGSAFRAHQVWIKATVRCDFYLEQPKHVVVLTGVTP